MISTSTCQVNHLLSDPYRSDEHEVIAVVVQDKTKGVVAGMSALLNDGVVHWFVERVGEDLDPCTVRKSILNCVFSTVIYTIILCIVLTSMYIFRPC